MATDVPADPLELESYRAAVRGAVVALDVQTEESHDLFRGRLGVVQSGGAQVLSVQAGAHSVSRTHELLSRAPDPEPYLKFTVFEQGEAMIVQDGREVLVRAGDIAVYDTSRPYTLRFGPDVRLSLVMFPRETVQMPSAAVSTMTATRLDPSAGIGDIVRNSISTLGERGPDLSRSVTAHLMRAAVELAEAVLESSCPSGSTESGRTALFRRISDYIDAQLADPELSPTRIAAAHFISVRQLHGLFQENGMTVSRVIRARRLEHSYEQLMSPYDAHRSVAAIAAANGFVDPAHFSRCFRARFGVAPSSLRP